MYINKAIFRSYDIRGNSLTEITNQVAYIIGFCFAKMHVNRDNNKICVGRDGRLSSPTLYSWLITGLTDGGAEVIGVGIVPTPILYFADKMLGPKGSIMVTGSHNPKNDNGFKMLANGRSFFGEQIQALMAEVLLCDKTIPKKPLIQECSNPHEVTIANKYLDRILQQNNINPDLKVAWDPGNGASGDIIENLIRKLPNYNIVINNQIDGNFPNHHPDPSILDNLEQLIATVKYHKCDFGIAFDGDADRIGVVTKNGKMVAGDQLLCLFAKDIVAKHQNATVIMDVKASSAVFDQIKLVGGNPIIWKTGHSYIKNKMFETNALIGGEMSGHIFFADRYYGYDDGIYAALRLLDLLSRSLHPLDEMLDALPKTFSTQEIKIPLPDEQKFQIIEQIKQKLKSQNLVFNDIDGIRMDLADGWWLLRCSNTGPALVARCESTTADGLLILKSIIANLLAEHRLKIE